MIAGQRVPAEFTYSTVYADMDWETYSEAGFVWDTALNKWEAPAGLPSTKKGLRATGVRNYCEHPTFEILSLAYDLKDGKGRRWWRPGMPPPVDLLIHVRDGKPLEAWNSGFEFQVWNCYCVPQLGWPPLTLRQMRCAMAKSRAAGYPGALGDAGKVLQLVNQKDPDGDRLIKLLTMPKQPTKKDPALRWTPLTKPDDFAKLYAYNGADIIAEAEASSKLPDLTPHEFEVWQCDQRINNRGMQIDRKAVDDMLVIVEQAFQKYNAELKQLTLGNVSNASEVQKMLRWLAGDERKIYLEDLGEETLEEALTRDYPPDVKRVLQIRQALSFGSVKKLYAFKYQTTRDSRLHDQYAYYGAHTSLWNGQNVQVSNLYKSKFKKPAEVERALSVIECGSLELVEMEYGGDALEVVANCLRSVIVAKPGHRLISADYSAIQAVVLAAIAGEQWRIDVFATHGKIYERTASDLSGVPFEEMLKHREETGKHHPLRQTLGKVAELSGGFAAWVNGWKKFGAAEIIGSDAEIKKAILKWRSASPMIVELWGGQTRNKFQHDERPELYGLEGAAVSAVLHPGQAFQYRGIAYQMHGDCLYCRPPSGGLIRYHAPRLESARSRPYASPWELDLSYEGWSTSTTKGSGRPGWQRMKLYGGVLAQNVDSHLSREVMANGMLRLEAADYPVVAHTHDEIISEVPSDFGTLEEFERLMLPVEDWARTPDGKRWPIKSSGWIGQRNGSWE